MINWIMHELPEGPGKNSCYAFTDGVIVRVHPHPDGGFLASIVFSCPFSQEKFGGRYGSNWTVEQRIPSDTQEEAKKIAEEAIIRLKTELSVLLGDNKES